jgi:deazaflavin-dependent oxidoreductase (nitroreductase family)
MPASDIDPALPEEDYCYVTTTGRVTGKPHRIEIWFALEGRTLYILAGGRHSSDWVKNVKKQPDVPVRIGAIAVFEGHVRIVEDPAEDALARRIVFAKYSPTNGDLEKWARTALPVAIELT